MRRIFTQRDYHNIALTIQHYKRILNMNSTIDQQPKTNIYKAFYLLSGFSVEQNENLLESLCKDITR